MSCTEEKMQLESDLAQEKAMNEMLQQQLGEAMMMLKAEKEAREELSATIALVQEASKQVQKEVEKLQFENHMLQQQVEKLKSEQGKYLFTPIICCNVFAILYTVTYKAFVSLHQYAVIVLYRDSPSPCCRMSTDL